MNKEELKQIIANQVKSKANALSIWKPVRWEGGRLYYESTLISQEIYNYDTDIKILYLEDLLSRKFILQDNWPSSAPDITQEFKNWIVNKITELKIKQFQEEKSKNSLPTQKKKRSSIPYKVKTLLQREIGSSCPFCSNNDVDHFQIHHIDENPENNDFKNLLMLCAICHSKITKGDISYEAVLDRKKELSIP